MTKPKDKEREHAIRLYKENPKRTQRSIAIEVGVSFRSISRWIEDYLWENV